jgi:hypothetical protein
MYDGHGLRSGVKWRNDSIHVDTMSIGETDPIHDEPIHTSEYLETT